jgi:hypothetical protein
VSSLHPEALTWAGLLAQWVRFAQASLVLPNDAIGASWRASVPAVINLQAVTFALADIQKLAREEHALALDKADLIIAQSASVIERAWGGDGPPQVLREIERDARLALAARRAAASLDAQSRDEPSMIRRPQP